MADTTYTSGVTVISSDTMNDLNRLHYTIFGDPADLPAVKTLLFNAPTFVTPALGTPASGVLTNCTGTAAGLTAGAVAIGGVTGLGTGVATALAVNVGSAGATVVLNGALGTPSSGTVTNLTGTASININGTVGATTPAAGIFTDLTVSGNTVLGDASGDSVTITGTPAGQVISGTYTPTAGTFTGVVTGVTPAEHHYLRIGNQVIVYGRASVTSSAEALLGTFNLSLPISSDITAVAALSGVGMTTIATSSDTQHSGCAVSGSAAADQATVRMISSTTLTENFVYSFMYTLA